MSKQRVLLIFALLFSLALAACGGGGEKAAPSGETPGASPAEGTITINLWHSETGLQRRHPRKLGLSVQLIAERGQGAVGLPGHARRISMAKVTASLSSHQVPALALLDGSEPQR